MKEPDWKDQKQNCPYFQKCRDPHDAHFLNKF